MKKIIETLLIDYISKLNDIAKHIEIKKIKTIEITTSKSNKVLEKIEDVENNKNIIYVITTNEKLSYKTIENAKEKWKNKGYAMFRINEENIKSYKANSLKYLYVGSSQEVKTRLKQHLGFGAMSTYSLHLNKWWVNKKINITLYEVNSVENMQLFEDLLWKKYKPFLGKMGRK